MAEKSYDLTKYVLQFHDFVLINNRLAGYEGKKIIDNPPKFNETHGRSIYFKKIIENISKLFIIFCSIS